MYPIRPTPTLIVDTWGFRLADPDGSIIGKWGQVVVVAGVPTVVMPGIERTVQALPDSST